MVLNTLQSIIQHCPTLKCVRCSSLEFTKHHFLALMTSGRSFTELSLQDCPNTYDSWGCNNISWDISPSVFHHLSSLQVLNLTGLVRLNEPCMLSLLPACANLKSLDIDGNMLTDKTGIYIGQHLLKLERLSISFCPQMTDRSLSSFAGLIHLRQLCLMGGSRFTFMGLGMCLRRLAASKKSEPGVYPGLDTLDITGFEFNMITPLLMVVKEFPGLRHLNLSCCKLTASHLNTIAEHCTSLVLLRLDYVKCPHYKPILGTAFPQLRFLGLHSSDLLDDVELQQLRKARPWLKISFAWS